MTIDYRPEVNPDLTVWLGSELPAVPPVLSENQAHLSAHELGANAVVLFAMLGKENIDVVKNRYDSTTVTKSVPIRIGYFEDQEVTASITHAAGRIRTGVEHGRLRTERSFLPIVSRQGTVWMSAELTRGDSTQQAKISPLYRSSDDFDILADYNRDIRHQHRLAGARHAIIGATIGSLMQAAKDTKEHKAYQKRVGTR